MGFIAMQICDEHPVVNNKEAKDSGFWQAHIFIMQPTCLIQHGWQELNIMLAEQTFPYVSFVQDVLGCILWSLLL